MRPLETLNSETASPGACCAPVNCYVPFVQATGRYGSGTERGVGVGGVAVLFCRRDSIYKQLGADCYDIDRDARSWPGGCPIIAHPPCRTWGTLKAFAKAPAHEHDLALWAVAQLRIWGGVIEHPASSDLWREAALPYVDGLPDEWGGWTLECDQFHWGHLARKRTRLYIVGVQRAAMPPIPHRNGEPSHCVSSLSGKKRTREERLRLATWKPELGPNRRDKTPADFAAWLLEVAGRAAGAGVSLDASTAEKEHNKLIYDSGQMHE